LQSGDKSGGRKRALQYIRITSPNAVQDAKSAVGDVLIVTWSTGHRYLVTGIEALGLTCAQLRTTANLDGIVAQYGQSHSAISEIITETVIMLDSSWSHLLDFGHVLLSPKNLAQYANAVHNCSAPM
jgi:hypothetical protein